MHTTNYQTQINKHLPKTAPIILTKDEIEFYRNKIKKLLKEKNSCIISHYYVDAEIQRLAEDTGGIVTDSLDMARFGSQHPAKTLMVAGVSFMGETAKILSPDKKILMPNLAATCSLDLSCPKDEFAKFCEEHKDREVVVYANTSAAIKAMADWVVTSSIAAKVITYLASSGKKILWAPDKYLGDYLQKQTGADMLLWNGSCIVHEEFKADGIKQLKQLYPAAAILVHPESPAAVIELADVVGSTSQLLKASATLPNDTFIVATDKGIFYKMHQASPNKIFIDAPTQGHGATCKSCAHCPWMAMNNLKNLAQSLEYETNEIIVEKDLCARAFKPLERMLEFK